MNNVNLNRILRKHYCRVCLHLTFGMWILILFIMCKFYASVDSRLNSGRSEVDDLKAYDQSLNKLAENYYGDLNLTAFSRFKAWNILQSNNGLSLKNIRDSLIVEKLPPGSWGTAVITKKKLIGNIRALHENGWKQHAFNQFVSNVIPVNRSLKDPRHELCKSKNYTMSNFSQVAVIICFHNEAMSTLLRTINSVVMRTKPELLKEIILVDDHSDSAESKKPLMDFINQHPIVRMIRCKYRKGLIRAKILGAKTASAPVLVFLDSHCECADGWLEPLLDALFKNKHTIVSPVIDHIHEDTFEYIPQDINDLQVGGFNWNLQFIWKNIPRSVLKNRKDITEPIDTPTISGGLFAIRKDYFKYLGYYDKGFDVWGGENLEISFKTWMCGGFLKIAPCSHVGHVFRKTFPYTGVMESLKKNLARLAEVWMDDYKKYFYERNGDLSGMVGNITEALLIRKNLNCKSFSWYLNNIYPDIDNPKNAVASGQIVNLGVKDLCMDASSTYQEILEQVQLYHCHYQGGNQFWVYTRVGELKRDTMCLEYSSIIGYVTLNLCRTDVTQTWIYENDTQRIKHVGTGKCLYPVKKKSQHTSFMLILLSCGDFHRQKWELENYNSSITIMYN